MWRPLKHCGYWTLAKLMSGFASRLPLSASWKIGDYIGELVFHQASVSRNRAKRQIIQALPSVSNVEHLALKCFQNLGKNLMEFLHFQQTEWVDTAVRIEGQRNLDQALSLERGVIVLMGHFGNWELVGATFARHGYKLNAIARPIRSKTINNLVVGNRRQAGYDSLDREKSLRKAFRCLKQNELLAILADVDTKTSGVFVNFFGRSAHTPVGPVAIARKTDAPLLPVFMVRQPDNTHHMIIEPALDLQKTEHKQHDLIENTHRFTCLIERYIRQYPEQWIWMHDRWKTRPVSN